MLTAGSGAAYDLGFSYNANGGNQNLTGSPDFGPRIVFVGDPGSGCSSDQYRAVQRERGDRPDLQQHHDGVGPQPDARVRDKRVDMSVSRDIRMGGNRTLEFRLDVFNVFDTVIYDQRNQNVSYNSPTDLTVRNSQTLADGSIDPTRLVPRNAGFGAATRALAMRSMQIQFRFRF